MPKKKSTTLFEDSLAELEQLVNQLEQGDISLEESLKSFERGVNLTRTCQKALQDAEQKVQILLEKNGNLSLESFTDE
jgi:exodeoxyribonuclease VII small subunit